MTAVKLYDQAGVTLIAEFTLPMIAGTPDVLRYGSRWFRRSEASSMVKATVYIECTFYFVQTE